jgi:hypothetical protein
MIAQSTLESVQSTDNIVFFDGKAWKGEGTIIILQTGAALHFDIIKTLSEERDGVINMTQQVSLKEINERWCTEFTFHRFEHEQFEVKLHNDSVGHLQGDGYYNDSDISWKIYDENNRIIGKNQFMHIQHDTYLINSTYQFPGTTQISISGFIQLENT